MSHRVFKPVILFHDHSYSSDPSGVTHRIHIPYGDPYYTPLIQKKKQKVGQMLELNGKAWYDIIKSTRPSQSPQTPPLENTKDYYSSLKQDEQQACDDDDDDQEEEEDDDESDNNSSITSSSCSSSPVPTTIITRKRRGNLPKIVTAVLKQWLIDHCRNPYPTEVEKTRLKDKTGLTLNQISNWFINARRRLLPQILDTVHPHHTEQCLEDDPMPAIKKKKRSRMSYFYNKDLTVLNSVEEPTTVVRRRRRYNKRSVTTT
ncbi:hypothetical protein HPULCUR_010279 [Helicostylum pulchrum]|uniref:Homeobox domain-containing protein n=1 Tax=Helicostylum pulchrum TaxID=562976 RepID=A0ABP9YET1_9FUNG